MVDDADRTDAGRCQIHHQRTAKTASADQQHARGFQLLLALAAHVLEDQVALVAVDFWR